MPGQFDDIPAMATLNKGPKNVTRVAADANGNLLASIKGAAFVPIANAITIAAPVPPGNPVFWFDAQDVDGLGNLPAAPPRALVVTAADAVVAASHTWTFANGTFSMRDVGGTLSIAGATNAANNATVTILSVTSTTVIVTSGVQTNETFVTPTNLTAVVTGLGIVDGGVVQVWANKGAFLTAGQPVNATRSAGSITFKKVAGSGREGNLSSVRSDGTGLMATAATAAIGSPATIGVVFSLDNLGVAPSGTSQAPCDGLSTGRMGFFIHSGDGIVNMVGGGTAATNLAMNGATYASLVGTFNGASSFVNLNGTQSTGFVNPTPASMLGVTLFSLIAGSAPMAGDILEYLCYVDGTTPAQIQSYFNAKFGVNPQ